MYKIGLTHLTKYLEDDIRETLAVFNSCVKG
jgi:hypothetical protein